LARWGRRPGALLTGDILQVTPDRMVSFMFSYPNRSPSPARDCEARTAGRAIGFDRIYGAFWERVIPANGREIVRQSVARYLAAINSLACPSGLNLRTAPATSVLSCKECCKPADFARGKPRRN
jgi:hypothetical protein